MNQSIAGSYIEADREARQERRFQRLQLERRLLEAGVPLDSPTQNTGMAELWATVVIESVRPPKPRGIGFFRRVADRLGNKIPVLKVARTAPRQQENNVPGQSMTHAVLCFASQSVKQPHTPLCHSIRFVNEAISILKGQSRLQPARGDRRFRHSSWRENRFYRNTLQIYLAFDQELKAWVDELELDAADQRRCRFVCEQLTNLLASANSLLNPAVLKRAVQTGASSD